MKNFFNKKFSTKTKLISSAISLMLIVCFAITGTVAWLIDATETVQDTFTYGEVNIELTDGNTSPTNLWKTGEDKRRENTDNKMIPGATFNFDPYVYVTAASEKCYIFVEIVNAPSNPSPLSYFKDANGNAVTMATGWTPVGNSAPNVYYREHAGSVESYYQIYSAVDWMVDTSLGNGAVTTSPSITITAYAIQMDYLTNNGQSVTDAAGAWAIINP